MAPPKFLISGVLTVPFTAAVLLLRHLCLWRRSGILGSSDYGGGLRFSECSHDGCLVAGPSAGPDRTISEYGFC